MNIGGRIIQNRNVFEHTKDVFFAKYKGHEIHVNIFKFNERSNSDYSYIIIKLQHRDNIKVCSGIIKRCDIKDVVYHALEEADLR